MKDHDNITGFGCGTRIGFCSVSELGYCNKCKKVFRYYYNLYSGLRKGEGNCPACGAGEHWEDIIRSHFIDTQIMMDRGLIHSNFSFMTDEKRRNLRKDVNDLLKIKRLFEEFEEKEHERFKEEQANRCRD